jgi:hypothetical protein
LALLKRIKDITKVSGKVSSTVRRVAFCSSLGKVHAMCFNSPEELI